MGDRDPTLHGAPSGCFSSEDYKEQCKLRNERDICFCIHCKKRSHYDFKFFSEICRLSYNKENFIEIFCSECGKIFSKAIKSPEINCQHCARRIRFINLIPDESLEYFNCKKLSCTAY